MRILPLTLMLLVATSAHAADAAKGSVVFNKCKACHTIAAGAPNRVGPNLWGVLGRPIGSVPGFKYSAAYESRKKETWTEKSLDAYLANPKAMMPGSRMAFPGLPNPGDRADLIAWLKTQK